MVLYSSNYYAPYAGVLVQSLIDHASAMRNYDIILFERNISIENKKLLKRLAFGHPNVSIRFYDPFPLLDAIGVKMMEGSLPVETYYGLLAPYVLRQYKKLLAIDSDMLIKRDIADLFDEDLSGACVGGVIDVAWQGYYEKDYVFAAGWAIREYCANVMTIKEPLKYINGGMYVFDCDKYRNAVDIKEILCVASEKPFMFADQCVMNYLFEGKIKFLNLAWNASVPVNSRIQAAIDSAPSESRESYNRALADPFILHWAAKPKPWICPDVQYGSEWWQVAQRTPFMGHIIARMIDGLSDRKNYYAEKYGQAVAAWEPVPNVDRRLK